MMPIVVRRDKALKGPLTVSLSQRKPAGEPAARMCIVSWTHHTEQDELGFSRSELMDLIKALTDALAALTVESAQ